MSLTILHVLWLGLVVAFAAAVLAGLDRLDAAWDERRRGERWEA